MPNNPRPRYSDPHSATTGTVEPQWTNLPDDLQRLELVREVLLRPDREQWQQIRQQLDNTTTDVDSFSRVLPAAVEQASARGPELADALGPTLADAFQTSVKRNPQSLVDAISPIMGPAIRQYISQAISGMVQSLNQTLEHSLSVKGLQWRWQAWRTGKPFGEVVLLNTLLYRVEQVFLIHRESGLLLQHVHQDRQGADPQLIGAMLTAIQDFVQDSFGGRTEESLSTMQVGEHAIWIEQGPVAVLACVIRGHAPHSLRGLMQETLEKIHISHRRQLDHFNGDATALDGCGRVLEQCCVSEYQTDGAAGRPRRWICLLWLLPLLGLLLLAAVWLTATVRTQLQWRAYLEKLRQQPGILVTESGRSDGKYFVTGLRDPLSIDPEQILGQTTLPPDDVEQRWEAYGSADQEFVQRRAVAIIEPPAGVEVVVQEGVLHLRGQAPAEWTSRASVLARNIPGVRQVDASQLGTIPAVTPARPPDIRKLLEQLQEEPGIVVTQAQWHDGIWQIQGLRDPLARNPEDMLPLAKVDATMIHMQWKPYTADEPALVLKRVRRMLKAPADIELELQGGMLVVRGEADHDWLSSVFQRAPLLAGIDGVDLSGCLDRDREQLRRAITDIESISLHFEPGEATMLGRDAASLSALSAQIGGLLQGANGLRASVSIRVSGYTVDRPGTSVDRHRELSQKRAETVVDSLVAHGYPREMFQAVAAGAEMPVNDGDELTNHRRVELKVLLSPSGVLERTEW